jgi:hypothetical protein
VFRPRWRSKDGLPTREVEVEQMVESVEHKRKVDRDRKKKKYVKRRNWSAAGKAALEAKREQWQKTNQAREQSILGVLRGANHRLSRPEIDKATFLSLAIVSKCLKGLVKRGDVLHHGGHGRYARYELASKARQGHAA